MTSLTRRERYVLADLTGVEPSCTDGDVSALRAVLLNVDPVTAPADDLLIEAAVSFGIDGIAWSNEQITWMQYACRSADRLHGPLSERAVSTLNTYAFVLAAQGLTHDALQVRETILLRCDATNGQSCRAAAFQYAIAAHADGHCETGVTVIRVLMRCRLTAGERRSASGLVLTHIGFLIGCGHDEQARQVAGRYATTIGPPVGADSAARTMWARIAMLHIDGRNWAHAAVCTNPGPDANTPSDQRLARHQWRAILEDPAAFSAGDGPAPDTALSDQARRGETTDTADVPIIERRLP